MKRNGRKNRILSLCVGTAVLLSAGVFSLDAFKANAESENADKLFSPVSYEEYLPLTAPADIAVSERYTAIADGNKIYLYDKTEQEYQTFTHNKKGQPNDDVKKLQFCENGKLYYADNSTGANFYELDLVSFSSSNNDLTDIACSTFTIDGTTLYFANSSGALYSASLTDYQESMPALPLANTPNKPTLAFWNGELYFTDNASLQLLNKYNPQTQQLTNLTALTANEIERMTITAGVLAYTTANQAFCTYTLPRVQKETLRFFENGVFTAVASLDNKIYAVYGAEIREYDMQTDEFTGFAICGNSSLPHRLNGAKDACVHGTELIVADGGNLRVSIYNQNGETQKNFPVDFAPEYISCGESEIFIADKTQVAVYTFNGEKQSTFDKFQGNITGIASVFDKHYFVTADNYYYQLSRGENGEFKKYETQKISHIPKMLTADTYGNLYIAGSGQNATYLYRFTESEFINPDKSGTQVLDSLPLNTQKISVDHNGNFYALADNKIYKNGNTQAEDFSSPLVYGESASINAFAFGAEENQTFLLCENNYLIQTTRLNLPNLKTVPVKGADKEIFSKESAEFIVVDVAQNALLIGFDLQALQGSEYFPYAGYSRAQTPLKALELGKSGEYSIIAVYDEAQKSYQTYYTRSAFTSVAKDYHAPYESAIAGYITSEVTLYKFPYLNKLLTADVLPRGAQVEILGELSLDHEYFEVRYQTADGAKTGYIPRSFVAETNGKPPQAETQVIGKEESNRDALFRLAYILLGLAAIAVLANYLLLRKKEK